MNRTYAIMDVSKSTYDEIKKKLEDAGYQHAIHADRHDGEVLDMHGIALKEESIVEKIEKRMKDSIPGTEFGNFPTYGNRK